MFADEVVAGFQFDLVCADTGVGIGALAAVANVGSSAAAGFQVSSGTTGTVVGVSLSGATIPLDADPLLVQFDFTGDGNVCEACIVGAVLCVLSKYWEVTPSFWPR